MCSARSRTSPPPSISPRSDGVSRNATAPGTEGFEYKAEARKLLGARDEPLDVGFVEFDDFRDQQDLPADAAFVDRGLEPLIDDAFMRGVLIDDDEPVARLRHDIGFVDLRPRRAERMIEKIEGGRRARDFGVGVGTHIRHRPADIEGRLRGFGKAAAQRRKRAPRIAVPPASAAEE